MDFDSIEQKVQDIHLLGCDVMESDGGVRAAALAVISRIKLVLPVPEVQVLGPRGNNIIWKVLAKLSFGIRPTHLWRSLA